MKKEIIVTENAPAAIGPYSQAVKAGGMVFVSGQIALDPESGEIIDGGVEEQTERALKNLSAVLEASGSSLDKVLKATVFISSMDNFAAINSVYSRYFDQDPPARVCVEVSALPKGAMLEIEVVALC